MPTTPDLTSIFHHYQATVQPGPLTQQAYSIILAAIRELYLQPGQSFLEREVSEPLGMSRTPVHEALIRLEAAGWLAIIPRRGFKVAPILATTITEIAQISENLDGLAVALATPRITAAELTPLNDLVAQQVTAMRHQDLRAYVQIDQRFHEQLVALAPNQRLVQLIASYSDQLYRARLYAIDERALPEQSVQEHRAILAAMQSRNARAAQELMIGHRQRGSREIIKIIIQKQAE